MPERSSRDWGAKYPSPLAKEGNIDARDGGSDYVKDDRYREKVHRHEEWALDDLLEHDENYRKQQRGRWLVLDGYRSRSLRTPERIAQL